MFIVRPLIYSFILALCILSQSCLSQVRPKSTRLQHKFTSKKTAYLDSNGKAHAPPNAPKAVVKMIKAANAITHLPYRRGGGRVAGIDHSGYDCSGASYYVLRAGGLIDKPLVSKSFMTYGKKGYGKWVNVYAKDGHVFLEIAGLRFDTGGSWDSTGPRWKPQSRKVDKFVVRHPAGY